jgi:hypothetical protein
LPRNLKDRPDPAGSAAAEPDYPVEIRIKRVDFVKMMSEARRSKDFSKVRDFYTEAFKSPGDDAINECVGPGLPDGLFANQKSKFG